MESEYRSVRRACVHKYAIQFPDDVYITEALSISLSLSSRGERIQNPFTSSIIVNSRAIMLGALCQCLRSGPTPEFRRTEINAHYPCIRLSVRVPRGQSSESKPSSARCERQSEHEYLLLRRFPFFAHAGAVFSMRPGEAAQIFCSKNVPF